MESSGSTAWRSSSIGAFSRSSREGEDDEEALQWAALEKLPTYDRLRKAIFTTSGGECTEIDVTNLGFVERKSLVQRLLGSAEEDNESFLLKVKNRTDRVGIELPTIEVRFEHLNVEAEAYVGSRALPTFLNYYTNIFEDLLNYIHVLPSRKRPFNILKDVSGVIKPSRMTLLLGPPSSGKTTLLLALAGKLDPDLKFSGRVTYNGHDMHEFIPQKTAAYISQNDVHIGEMTVRETLAFSARCQGVGSRYDMLAELARREKASNIKPDPDIDMFMKAASTKGQNASVVTDYYLKILGLEVCEDTILGDAMRRGISGGQRKRVTIGEMLVGPAKALFMDEISTGLDSSTTFQIVKSLKQYIHILNGTALISLLQPAPETYDLFDDIILLSDGQIVYQGPREQVLDFFESMGFKCTERKGVADFLQEVTSRKDQEQYWCRKNCSYRFVTSKEFSEAFSLFHVGRRLGEQLALPFDKRKSHPAALTRQKYGAGKMELFKACASREYLLMKRNSFVYTFKLFQLAFVALVTATVFLRTKMHRNSLLDGDIFVGALFFSMLIITFNGMSEISMTIGKLPVFYKQRGLFFYPSWAYSLPACILKIPITFSEVISWVSITYYVIGFDPNVERFLRQFLVLLLVHQSGLSLFRLIAAIGRNMIIGNTLGSFAVVMLVGFDGVVLAREDIKKWWKWAYWISSMMYGQNAIVVNEFLGNSWKHVPPNATESLGVVFMSSRGFFPHAYWYWIGVGALLGFMLMFNLCFALALTYLNPLGKPQAFMSAEPEEKASNVKTGQAIKLSSQQKSNGHRSNTEDDDITRIDTILPASENRRRGVVLPFQQHCITFDNINYSVDMPLEMKNQGVIDDRLVLLKGLSGAFRPGVLTALMGVSGAGKTTLMDVLAGRKTCGYIEGNITISGYPKKQESFARVSGYCEQNDIHSPHVTVYESLLYSAWLRLPSEVNEETRKMFIEEVMELVELKPLRQALVGLPGVNGLSTEQRKRLTIAVELVANPSIIFMDEPTSGLDARAAAIVMRTVRNTVDSGRTVVCTIHQPSIDIFEAFDELILMKRGGQEIYVGPLGLHCSRLIDYFEKIKGVSKIKDGYNPATWMLDITTSAKELELGVDFADIYRNSELYRRNKALIQELSTPPPGSKDLHFPTQYSQPFFTQWMACFWKQRCSYWRNPKYTAVRSLYTIFMALALGSIFWSCGSKKRNRQDIFNAMGSMFSTTLYLGFQYRTSVQPVVAVERAVFYRERAAGMYAAMAYGIAQIMIELPYVFVQAVAYSVVVYAMIGFEWTVAKFFWYIFFLFFTLLYLTFYGMMCVAFTPNLHISSVISTALYMLWILFSGFFIPRTRIPVWWRWFYWTSPMAWTMYGLTASQFGDVKDKLDTGQTVEEFLREYYGFKHDFLGVVAAAIVGFPVLFAFVFALLIKVFNFQRR